jgi:hypothetical protein
MQHPQQQQQQQQQHHLGLYLQQQQQSMSLCLPQQLEQQVFSLPGVPMSPAAVEVQHLGAFKFKGGAMQQMQMANVTLASLTGRVRFIPEQPPKGKGERVALGKGAAAQGHAPLPTLVQQYRARVPAHILECHMATDAAAAAAAAGGYAKTNEGGNRTGDLRTTSAPQRLPSATRRQKGSDDGNVGVVGGELIEVLGLRRKSHSFTCPCSPGMV